MMNTSSIDHVDNSEKVGFLDESLAGYEQDAEYIAEMMALEFAEEVARRIKSKGISRAQLARDMGVSRAYITRILDAPPNLTLQSIAKIAQALGMKPELRLSNDGSGKWNDEEVTTTFSEHSTHGEMVSVGSERETP